MFRVPFTMERMAVGSITASLQGPYLTNYSAVINHITSKGAYAVLDPHNYGRYNGAIISSTSDFGTFWKNLATVFKSNSKVVRLPLSPNPPNKAYPLTPLSRSSTPTTNTTTWTKLSFSTSTKPP